MQKIFYGWWIVLATSLIHMWGAGTFYYGFTAFFNPIVDELGWSYAATSFAASLRSIEGGIASPLVGFATDRYGARRLLVLGSVLGGLGFILLGQIQSLWSFYLIFVFLSVGSSLLFPVPGWTAVANWFVKKRGIALGALSASMGIAGLVIYLVNWLIALYGWRQTLVVLGIGMWVIGIPSALVVRTRPEPYGLLPDGDDALPSKQGESSESLSQQMEKQKEFTARAALRTRAFWMLAIVVTLSAAALHAVVVHIMPYLVSIRFSREAAGLTASVLILVSAMGRFVLGWLTSRLDTRYLLAFALLLQALGMVALTRVEGLGMAALFVVLFGPGYGGVITLRLTMQAEFFGSKAFGAIQGIMMAILIIGTMASPLLAGYCFDLYGTYGPAWLVMAILLFLAIPISILVRPPGKQRVA
jgi:sugar phosphate permease